MTNLKFISPSGSEQDAVSFEQIRSALVKGGDAYWHSGSGDAGLRFSSSDRKAEMILMQDSRFGVFVHHLFVEDKVEYVLNNKTVGVDDLVKVKQGGQDIELPRSFFVDQDTALKAIEYYMQTGGRKDDLDWVRF